MKCPNCGQEITVGLLFCENCGYEVHMVPDYDPLDEVAIGRDEHPDVRPWENSVEAKEEMSDDGIGTGPEDHAPAKKKRGGRAAVICAAVLVTAAAVVFAAVTSYRTVSRSNSYIYQMSRGEALYDEGEYEEAASYLAKALALQGAEGEDGMELLTMLAYTYAYIGEDEAAVDCVEEAVGIAQDMDADIDVIYGIYKQYMDILNLTGQTQLINDIIENCGDQELTYLLYDYRISAPECSEEAGTYTFYLRLTLSAEFGRIYYTLDGTSPTSESELYKESFTIMDEGETLLRAVAINSKGMVSPELEKVFILDFQSETVDDTVEY